MNGANITPENGGYTCDGCGSWYPLRKSQCPHCLKWNSMIAVADAFKTDVTGLRKSRAIPVTRIEYDKSPRFSSGYETLDVVYGRGLPHGAALLLGGDAGIGKSTITTQIVGKVCKLFPERDCIYISGEESEEQIKERAERLDCLLDNFIVLKSSECEDAVAEIVKRKPILVICDSAQTIVCEDVEGIKGSPNQVKSVTQRLTDVCKSLQATIFFICHITKDESIAGPKTIQHLVDIVTFAKKDVDALTVDDESVNPVRITCETKNRYGAVGRFALFNMTENGLVPRKA